MRYTEEQLKAEGEKFDRMIADRRAKRIAASLARNQAVMPKILVIDIETTPIEALVWRIFDENVGLDQIQKDTTILSFAAQWVGSTEMIYMDTSGRGPDKIRDDSILMQPLWNLLNEADIVVAQNGRAFDVKRINSRMLHYGMKPYSPIKVVDTKWQAKNKFSFTSNKLEWMAPFLTRLRKSTHKKFPGIELWLECLKDNPVAFAELKKYNIIDVIACLQIYLRFLPWDDKHPNVSTYDPSGKPRCPKCGSTHVHPDDVQVLQVGVYTRFVCEVCGGWSRAKTMLNNLTTRKAKLV